MAEAALYLTGRGYVDVTGEAFGAADNADLMTVVEALYRKAGFSQLPGEFGEVLEDGTRLFEYAFEKRL